jgi:coenzyme F420-0:L-glutamate ligase/coenzyme F420-1:gamma-L-glutamate ligase
MTTRFVLTALPEIPLIRAGDDLATLILDGLRRADIALQHGDIIVVSSKVVSKAEDRACHLAQVEPSAEALRLAGISGKDPRVVEVLLTESKRVLKARKGVIIVEHRLGFVCANAGLDHSNVPDSGGQTRDWVLMLPSDPDASAHKLRARLQEVSGAEIGVLIIDSHGRAWRLGTVGTMIGVSGMPALLDLRGRPDLFNVPLKTTEVGLGDEVAAAASIIMGQADEGRPVVHARGLPYPLREASLQEILRPEKEDLFR